MNVGNSLPIAPAHGEVFFNTGSGSILMFHGRYGWYNPTLATWVRLVLK
jgi:hypothetical protein